MAELLNRQVLINLHSTTGTTDAFKAKAVEGEIGIFNPTVEGAKIFTKAADGNVAVFVTENAVDAKVKVVNDALTAHKEAYATQVGKLEKADSDNASAIAAAEERIAELESSIGDTDGALGSRVSKLEDDFAEFDRVTSESLSDLDAAIKAETSARTEALGTVNGKIDTIEGNLSAEVTARENADKALKGVSGDATTAETIWGAKNAAAAADAKAVAADGKADAAQADATQALTDAATAQSTADDAQADATQALTDAATAQSAAEAAQSAADDAQADATQALTDAATAKSAADAAQADATYAKTWVDAFKNENAITEGVVDTLKEIQDYITSDAAAADQMVKNITAAQDAADAAQDAADAADAKAAAAATAAATAQGAADAAAAAAATADAKAVSAQTTADAAQLDATSALDKISAAKGTTTSTGGVHVTVETTESEGKVTSITVVESNIASASDLETLDSAAVKSVQFVGNKDAKVTGTVDNTVLKLNFDNLYIDCGTF